MRASGWAAVVAACALLALVGFAVVMSRHGECSGDVCMDNIPLGVAVAFAYVGLAAFVGGIAAGFALVRSLPRRSDARRRGWRIGLALVGIGLLVPGVAWGATVIPGRGQHFEWARASTDGGIECGPSGYLEPGGSFVKTTTCAPLGQTLLLAGAGLAGLLAIAAAVLPRRALLAAPVATLLVAISVGYADDVWGNHPNANVDKRGLVVALLLLAALAFLTAREQRPAAGNPPSLPGENV